MENIVKLPLTPNELLNFASLDIIVKHLDQGGLVILPTETGYLLAANALDVEAVKKVFIAKDRPITNPIHVVVSDLEMANELVELPQLAKELFYHFLPGPVTPVCPKKDVVSDFLVANTGYLGLRVPDVPVVLQVVRALGKPITATSLNLSGQDAKNDVEDTMKELHWGEEKVCFVRLDHVIKYDKPSTLVQFKEDGWEILREGAVSKESVEAVLLEK